MDPNRKSDRLVNTRLVVKPRQYAQTKPRQSGILASGPGLLVDRMQFDQLKRRELITLLGCGALIWPLAARAQQAAGIRRVGVLMGYAETDPAAQAQVTAFRQELQKLGWEEGRSIRVDVRFPGTDVGRVRAMLMELISLTPDVLVSNTNLVTAVVQAEVRTTPIVFISIGDPVVSGFVSNEARPNSNLTGFANWNMSISGRKMAGAAQGGRAPGHTRRVHGASRDGWQYWVFQIC
jgi:ABC transporter substrate binding protein